jgi:(p)ppGpp synthase/HD superfamily hydrolase
MNPSEKSPGADVYAGDTASPGVVGASDRAIHFFNIEAESEPGTFARIANVLNIANVSPSHVTLESRQNDGTLTIHVELRVRVNTAQSIRRKLIQLTDVIHVDMSILSSIDPPRRSPD